MATSYYSKKTHIYLQHLANLLQIARKTRNVTVEELGKRCDISKRTMIKVLQGDPTVKIGVYFQAAVVLDIPLFEEDESRLQNAFQTGKTIEMMMPRRIQQQKVVLDDNF